MLLADQLRSFHRRRIAVPVSDAALVLDVGSGDKPSWRADVLLDRYVGAEHAGQRSGTDAARVTRPLFDAPADDMPFADGAFDYAICSHVLEHVPDPAAVIGELTRVAKAGYIEVPEASSAKIIDFPSHLWWCRLDESTEPPTLVFQAKDAAYFDADIARYIARSGVEARAHRPTGPAVRPSHRVAAMDERRASARRGHDLAAVARGSDGRREPPPGGSEPGRSAAHRIAHSPLALAPPQRHHPT